MGRRATNTRRETALLRHQLCLQPIPFFCLHKIYLDWNLSGVSVLAKIFKKWFAHLGSYPQRAVCCGVCGMQLVLAKAKRVPATLAFQYRDMLYRQGAWTATFPSTYFLLLSSFKHCTSPGEWKNLVSLHWNLCGGCLPMPQWLMFSPFLNCSLIYVSLSFQQMEVLAAESKKWRHFMLFQVTKMTGLENSLAFPCRRSWRWRHSFQAATGQGFPQELHKQAGITSDQDLRVPSTVVDHTCAPHG